MNGFLLIQFRNFHRQWQMIKSLFKGLPKLKIHFGYFQRPMKQNNQRLGFSFNDFRGKSESLWK